MSVALAGSVFPIDDPIPPSWTMTSEDIRARSGVPDLQVGTILAYDDTFARQPADLTFWLTGDRLSQVTLAFVVDDASSSALRSRYTRVAKELRRLYGVPDSSIGTYDSYRTDVWTVRGSEIIHGVVFMAGRREHYVVVRPVIR